MLKDRRFLKRISLACIAVPLAGALAYHVFLQGDVGALPAGIAYGNGRLEATEVDIATKTPGRLAEVLVDEGDLVEEGRIVARMDITSLEAQLRQAEAEVTRFRQARLTAISRTEGARLRLELADKELKRSKDLYDRGVMPEQQYDRDRLAQQTLQVEYAAAKSSVAEVEAAIASAVAQTERLNADISDCMLKCPIKGPVLIRLAEPGEVLPAGGKVLTVVNIQDVYMNVFLSERVAGMVPLGSDAKVVLDAIPDRPFAARVAYVSQKAQFTPKEVEAAEERQKLVFRVTVSLTEFDDPRLKPGMPGVAYVRLDPAAGWPERLK
jgi:HlyD family secretion protein